MWTASLLQSLMLAQLCTSIAAHDVRSGRAEGPFVGYLISTFTDRNPAVQWYLSKGNDPGTYVFLNKGQPILKSTLGTKAVRDVFLATNAARDQWFMLGTDLDVKVAGFSWDKAVRKGSRSVVVWKSADLVKWSDATLLEIEEPTAGMVWAPCAVWDDETNQYYVFWASRFYATSDPDHKDTGSLNRIRYATTKDFVAFSTPKDYINFKSNSIIDQEFLYLGMKGHYARFYKDETAGSHVVIETTTEGLFGNWTKIGNVRSEGSLEGPASFADNTVSGKYYLLLDNYTQYIPFETSNITKTPWGKPDWPNFPAGLKHGSVTPLTQKEYDAISAKYTAK